LANLHNDVHVNEQHFCIISFITSENKLNCYTLLIQFTNRLSFGSNGRQSDNGCNSV